MESQIYTPQFQSVYQKTGSSLPIGQWHSIIGKKLQQFQNPSNVFMPVSLHIQMAPVGSDVSAATLKVSPTADGQWYEKLVEAVKTMLGVQKPIEIQTYMGKPSKFYAMFRCCRRHGFGSRETFDPSAVGAQFQIPRENQSLSTVKIHY
jgi:hypothetical protein